MWCMAVRVIMACAYLHTVAQILLHGDPAACAYLTTSWGRWREQLGGRF
jgi:hypothetical protein